MKAIIFDASTLISFAMNGLLDEVAGLRKIFKGKFIVTRDVEKEIVDKPIKIKRFELEALQIQRLIDTKVLEKPSSLGIDEKEISKGTFEIMDKANSIFASDKKEIKLIDKGEASCLALARILNQKKIESVLAIDERTMRMLIEKPENLEKLLRKKLHTRVTAQNEGYKDFGGFKVIRSTELIYVAYKKGLIDLKGKLVLDALLYALKFKGASISGDEIRQIKNIG
jgi:predicted nucleic acid-binding protein